MSDYVNIHRVQVYVDKELKKQKKELIEEFLSDIIEIRKYFKLDGHLIASKIKKWEERLK